MRRWLSVGSFVRVSCSKNRTCSSGRSNAARLRALVLQSVAVCCRVLQSVAVWCGVVQCGAVCGSVLQCIAVCVTM